MISINYIITGGFFIFMLLSGWYYRNHIRSFQDFALSRGQYSTLVMVFTYISTLIGGGHTVGVIQKIYSEGLLFVLVFFGMPLEKFFGAKYIVPRIVQHKNLYSLGELMGRLYGARIKIFTSLFCVISGIGSLVVQMMAMGYLMQYFFEIPMLMGALLTGSIMVLYSFWGGIKVIAMTDVVQFCFIVIVIPLVSIFLINKAGGLLAILPTVKFDTLDKRSMSLWSYAALFVINAIPYLHVDLFNKYLICKNLKQIRICLYSAIVFEIFLLIIFTFVGLGLRFLTKDSNIEFFSLLSKFSSGDEILPSVFVVGFLAIMLSTADSILHACSVELTQGVICIIFKQISEKLKLSLVKTSLIFCGAIAIIITLFFDDIVYITAFFSSLYTIAVLIPLFMALFGYKTTQMQCLTIVSVMTTLFFIVDSLVSQYYSYIGFLGVIAITALTFFVTVYFAEQLKHLKATWCKNDFSIGKWCEKDILAQNFCYETVLVFLFLFNIIPHFFLHIDDSFYSWAVCTQVLALLVPILFFLISTVFNKTKYIAFGWYIVLLITLVIIPGIHVCISKGNLEWLISAFISLFLLSVLVNWRSCILLISLGTFFCFIFHYFITWEFFKINYSTAYFVAYFLLFLLFANLIWRRQKDKGHMLNMDIAKTLAVSIAHELLPKINRVNKLLVNVTFPEKETLITTNNQMITVTNSLLMNAHDYVFDKNIDFSVRECIKQVLEEYPFDEGQREMLQVEVKEDFSLNGEPTYFGQIFVNLIRNALYHSDKTKETPIVKIIIDGIERSIEVFDNGLGIDAQHLPYIFDAFYTTKKAGTGIGLHFCSNVIKIMGGSIVCQSSKNQYTKFIIQF